MRKVHPEFAYQSRELGGQIDGILGDPPNRKNYEMMQSALVSEYAAGGGIEDVNMMSFALVDHITFSNAKGLLAEAGEYDGGNPEKVFTMAACEGDAAAMYAAMTENHPDLARQAIITAFLFKNPRMWDEEDQSFDQLGENDDGDDVEDDDGVSDDFAQMFDQED
ncbi:hypothetical protein KY495_02680 [Massilia sp. PAMC28688]|uniref:hypothetical protein n=1 Tax=Massilia sp. PAMC28688 TaxID=2861283 RepID=UPI001C637809|nr:hypothetical protein [Massilia sp. PAMC28688]QYF94157.1 hypothetical protein KY495_02680 [Massilia sp. PAMC28688]